MMSPLVDFISDWAKESYEISEENLKVVSDHIKSKIHGVMKLSETGFSEDVQHLAFIMMTAIASFSLMIEGSGDIDGWLSNFEIQEIEGTPPEVVVEVSSKLENMEEAIEAFLDRKKKEMEERQKGFEEQHKTLPKKKKAKDEEKENQGGGSSHLSLLLGSFSWLVMMLNFILRSYTILAAGSSALGRAGAAITATIYIGCSLSICSGISLAFEEKQVAIGFLIVSGSMIMAGLLSGSFQDLEGTLLILQMTTSCFVAGTLESEEVAKRQAFALKA